MIYLHPLCIGRTSVHACLCIMGILTTNNKKSKTGFLTLLCKCRKNTILLLMKKINKTARQTKNSKTLKKYKTIISD